MFDCEFELIRHVWKTKSLIDDRCLRYEIEKKSLFIHPTFITKKNLKNFALVIANVENFFGIIIIKSISPISHPEKTFLIQLIQIAMKREKWTF